MKIKKYLKIILIFSFIFFVNKTLFAEELNISQNPTTPLIEVKSVNTKIDNEQHLISGSFLITNNSTLAVSNIGWNVILQPEPERFKDGTWKSRPMAEFIKSENADLMLAPGESKRFNFSLNYSPFFKSSKYILLINISNKLGYPLGGKSVNISLEGNGIGMVDIKNCELIRNDGVKFSLGEGPNTDPNSTLKLQCSLTNPRKESLILYPRLTTAELFVIDFPNQAYHEESELSSFTLNSKETKKIIFDIITPQESRVYQGAIRLFTDKKEAISNYFFFRYTVRGEGARIEKIKLNKDYYKKGENALINFSYYGSSDLFWQKNETDPDPLFAKEKYEDVKPFDSIITFKITGNPSLTSSEKITCGEITQDIKTNDPHSQESLAKIAINNTCYNPEIFAQIGEDGKVYSKISIPTKTNFIISKSDLLVKKIIAFLLVVFITLSFIFLFKKKKVALFLCLLFFGGAIFLFSHYSVVRADQTSDGTSFIHTHVKIGAANEYASLNNLMITDTSIVENAGVKELSLDIKFDIGGVGCMNQAVGQAIRIGYFIKDKNGNIIESQLSDPLAVDGGIHADGTIAIASGTGEEEYKTDGVFKLTDLTLYGFSSWTKNPTISNLRIPLPNHINITDGTYRIYLDARLVIGYVSKAASENPEGSVRVTYQPITKEDKDKAKGGVGDSFFRIESDLFDNYLPDAKEEWDDVLLGEITNRKFGLNYLVRPMLFVNPWCLQNMTNSQCVNNDVAVSNRTGAPLDPDGTPTAKITRPLVAPLTDLYSLTISTAGNGSGIVTVYNGSSLVINCGNGNTDCGEFFLPGEVKTLTATPVPNTNSSFIGWSNCSTQSTSPLTITMDGNKNCTATFIVNNPPVAEASIIVQGRTCRLDGTGGTRCSSNIPLEVNKGDIVTISSFEADKDINGDSKSSYDLDGWSDPNVGVSNGGKCEWNTDFITGMYEETINNPANVAACNLLGTYNIKFYDLSTDQVNGDLFEVLKITDKPNTVGKSNIRVLVRQSPDLTISQNPSLNTGSLIDGNIVTFKATIKNIGDKNVSAVFKNHFQIDLNNDGNVDYDLTPDPNINSLNINEEKVITSGNWTVQGGTHRVIICTDSNLDINESDEKNNCGSRIITMSSNLSLDFTANPNSGQAPLNSTLTAQVSGFASGNINYTFWWNCNDPTTSVNVATIACGDPNISSNGAVFNNQVPVSLSATHTYTTEQIFKAKVITERGGFFAQKIIQVSTACTDECSTSICTLKGPIGKYKTCGNYDADSCLELNPVANYCAAGESCINNGECKAIPVITFNTDKSMIKKGDSATLSWGVINVDNDDCVASNSESSPQFTGVKSQTGNKSVSPVVSTDYTLTCINTAGNATQSVTILIENLPVGIKEQ